jgi:hypothetical protein
LHSQECSIGGHIECHITTILVLGNTVYFVYVIACCNLSSVDTELTLLTQNPFYLLLHFLLASSIGTPDLTGSGAQTNNNNNNNTL